MLEIIPSEGPPAENKMKDPGLRHLEINVNEFDAAYEALRKQGVKFLGEPYLNGTNRMVFFTDCDGNFVHLVQRQKPLT
jgi:predicted enzyme related to lactoylglutathione lyase